MKPHLIERISEHGPLSIAEYMAACLHDPEAGYYATRPALGGEAADFLTAPEASQMFGELLGAWCAHEWGQIGAPAPVNWIELGPGRGVLMQDALRAAKRLPAFAEAARVHFVETSRPLRAEQAARAPGAVWHDRLEDIPPGPSLILANEFLDCLPIRQFVRDEEVWREKLVGLDAGGALVFGLSPPLPFEGRGPGGGVSRDGRRFTPPPTPSPTRSLGDRASIGTGSQSDPVGEGETREIAPGLPAVIDALAARLNADPGRALLIDYGYAQPEGADTLQALKQHRKVDPLACPGEADLTAHVDFAAVAALAEAAGLDVAGPIPQGRLLRSLGLDQRTEALARAHPDRLPRLSREHARLTAPEHMGALFLCLCLSSRGLPPAAGF